MTHRPDGLMLPDGVSGTVGPGADGDGLPRTVHAAGAVLWRDGRGGPEVAVVHRPHHRDWSLPKGKVDPGESRARTAVREVAEETGFAASLGRHLATVRYPVGADRKVVDYWDARAGEGAFVPGGETDELRWLRPSDAAGLLTYDSDREVLDAFAAGPHPIASLLLVRHAKAGKRGSWGSWGDDDERPLVDEGRDQARRIAELLTAHGVRRLYAAPRARCRQTLEPASHRLGVGISDDPAFSDEAVEDDPERARARLRELAAGGPTAVCAQGYGIPTLVRDLATGGPTGPRPDVHSNRRLADPPARKGSVWSLSFHLVDGVPGRLVAADYVRDPAV